MKRYISVILAVAITFSMPLLSSASVSTGNVINIDSFTVEFEYDSIFTTEEQLILAQQIVTNSTNNNSTTYNLWCTMFGHDTSTETVTVIEHCVSDSQPRCIKSFQELTACSRCDYVDIVELSSIYIYCCE